MEYERLSKRYGQVPKWSEYLSVFRANQLGILARLGLPEEALDTPSLIQGAEWPAPGRSLWGSKKDKVAAFVTGTRHAALRNVYENHYRHQSAQAHARLAAVAVEFMVDHPEHEWNPGAGTSNAVIFAMLCFVAICSEVNSAVGYKHQKLIELWTYLRASTDEAEDLWTLRYQSVSS
jgi:hypothetical protein